MKRTVADPGASPSGPWQANVGFVVLLLVFGAYCGLLHWVVVSRAMPVLGIALVATPWLIAAASLGGSGGRTPRRIWRWIAIAVVLVTGVVLGLRVGPQRIPVDIILFVENNLFLVALSGVFAQSLRPSREPLVTRLARLVRDGDMSDAVTRYTRAVTIAWCAFFAIASLVSIALFATQTRAVWSTFVNLLLWPLAFAAFALEYAVRLRVLRDLTHVSMLASMQAFRQRDRVAPLDAGGGAQ